jgi:hypothetical protein
MPATVFVEVVLVVVFFATTGLASSKYSWLHK